MWMIETASYIDFEDENWSCMFVYEKTMPWGGGVEGEGAGTGRVKILFTSLLYSALLCLTLLLNSALLCFTLLYSALLYSGEHPCHLPACGVRDALPRSAPP